MRVRKREDGVTVFALSGTYVVHLGFNVTQEKREGLLGFAVRRQDLTEGEREGRWTLNMRTFAGEERDRNFWPTDEAPVQKFRWGDYTAKPSHQYVYEVFPAYGKPGQVRLGPPVQCAIDTEDPTALKHSDGTVHQVHFSRSGAASQAYIRRFGEARPDEVPGGAALRWLSRGLLEGLVAFIDDAGRGDELHIAIYEFQLEAILDAVRRAVKRGVKLRVLYDAGSSATAPKDKNEAAIANAGLKKVCRPRAGLKSRISHHKFMVRVRNGTPESVWTGSTNMSMNGIYAQLNVGHAIFQREIAEAYLALHAELWENDPPSRDIRTFLIDKYESVRLAEGVNCGFVFSPRSKEEAMEFYLELMKGAESLVVLTTPFGVDKRIVKFLETSSPRVVKFGLTGQPGKKAAEDIRRIDGIDGTNYTMPARIDTVLDRWQEEQFQFKSHAYIHTKFLLIDPLSDSPLLVTGSANFSKASCVANDENMLVLRGHQSAADVYLTEFLRMFEHYAFRHFVEGNRNRPTKLPLAPTDRWTDKYFKPKSKREFDRLLFSGEPVE
jgi:phosphatidylserine/phosphatidylglycerophosphate/cardiolipin synthase-like enzyme